MCCEEEANSVVTRLDVKPKENALKNILFLERGEIHYEENGKVRRSHLFLPTVTREDGGKYR